MNLAEAHAKYITRAREAGKIILAYRIPACGHRAESIAAPDGEYWDTVATCIVCGALYIKITEGSRVTALEMPK